LRDVARAAEGVPSLVDADDGHWRLGRDALDLAAKVDVEHRVPDHGDPSTGSAIEERQEPIAGEGAGHGSAN
jgi:hypothetical protein